MNRSKRVVAVAGATGKQGQLIVKYLLKDGVKVRALIRTGSSKTARDIFALGNIDIVEVDYTNLQSLVFACMRVDCVISALPGVKGR